MDSGQWAADCSVRGRSRPRLVGSAPLPPVIILTLIEYNWYEKKRHSSPIDITTAKGDISYPCRVSRLRGKPRKWRWTTAVGKRSAAGTSTAHVSHAIRFFKPHHGSRKLYHLSPRRGFIDVTVTATIGYSCSFGAHLPTASAASRPTAAA